MKIATLLILMVVLYSIPSFGQRTSIIFKIKKNTLGHTEVYENVITAALAPNDQVLLYEVYYNGSLKVPIENNIALISFVTFFKGGHKTDTIQRQEYKLFIKLKTLQLDTVVNNTFSYYVKPDPAATRKFGDERLKDARVFPEVQPTLLSHNKTDLKKRC
jgi:hypothetical protein